MVMVMLMLMLMLTNAVPHENFGRRDGTEGLRRDTVNSTHICLAERSLIIRYLELTAVSKEAPSRQCRA